MMRISIPWGPTLMKVTCWCPPFTQKVALKKPALQKIGLVGRSLFPLSLRVFLPLGWSVPSSRVFLLSVFSLSLTIQQQLSSLSLSQSSSSVVSLSLLRSSIVEHSNSCQQHLQKQVLFQQQQPSPFQIGRTQASLLQVSSICYLFYSKLLVIHSFCSCWDKTL